MTSTEQGVTAERANRIIESVRDAEESALEAVRKFVDTVTDAFPDLGEDGPRRKIIDSAFKMTEEIVGASNDLAQRIVKATSDAVAEGGSNSASASS